MQVAFEFRLERTASNPRQSPGPRDNTPVASWITQISPSSIR